MVNKLNSKQSIVVRILSVPCTFAYLYNNAHDRLKYDVVYLRLIRSLALTSLIMYHIDYVPLHCDIFLKTEIQKMNTTTILIYKLSPETCQKNNDVK